MMVWSSAARILVLICFLPPICATASNPVFTPLTHGTVAAKAGADGGLRVNVDWESFDRSLDSDMRLNLGAHVSINTRLIAQPTMPSGASLWFGNVAGDRRGSVILLRRNHRLTGTVIAFGNVYEIRAVDRVHLITEIRRSEDDQVVAVDVLAHRRSIPGPKGNDDGSVVDVLVAYGGEMLDVLGDAQAVHDFIDMGEVTANMALSGSGIDFQIRVVHKVQVDAEGVFIGGLTGIGDGQVDELHPLRDQFGADIVSLWVETLGPCGIANQMLSVSPGFASMAFNMVDRGCVAGLTFPHEIGHNMGANHDWFSNNLIQPFSFGKGYVDPDNAGGFRTIMGLSDLCFESQIFCPRVPHFANPDVNFMGAPTGVPIGTSTGCTPGNSASLPCDADVRMALNSSSMTVANFRQTTVFAEAGLSAGVELVRPGEQFEVTVHVTNRSERSANNPEVDLRVPMGLELVPESLSNDATFDGIGPGSTIRWSFGSQIVSGVSDTREVTFLVTGPGTLTLEPTIQVSDNQLVVPGSPLIVQSTEIATCGFFDGFEAGAFGDHWFFAGTTGGRARVTNEFPANGDFGAVLEALTRGLFVESQMMFRANLVDAVNTELSFSWRGFGDQFNRGFDEVFIRESPMDSWESVFEFRNGNAGYQTARLDLNQLAADAGKELTEAFEIRFGFRGTFPIVPDDLDSGDGIGIDDVSLSCEIFSNETDLAVAIRTDGPVLFGAPLTYIVTVTNPGMPMIEGARLQVLAPTGLLGANNVDQTVDIAPGGSIDIMVSGTVGANLTEPLMISAEITPTPEIVDPDLSNNRLERTDQIAVFLDGYEVNAQ